jgi:hypothetical protein
MEYPELNRLILLRSDFQLRVESLTPSVNSTFFKVRFSMDDEAWEIFIDNEYKYFDESKQLLCIYLVLSALEDYKEATDYLQWCKHNGLNASELQWLEYYKELGESYATIENRLHKIDSCISSLDYQLRSGAFAALLNY